MSNPIKQAAVKVESASSNYKPDSALHENLTMWSEPEPLEHSLYPVELLPSGIVPEQFRDWTEDVSRRMQCPSDFVASATMVLCGSLIGTKCGIKPKANDDWLVIPNLWGGVVGRPSMPKTPSLTEALKPLGRLESTAKRSHDEVLREHEVNLMEWEAKKDALKSSMRSAVKDKGGKPIEQIKGDLINLEKPQSPAMTRYKSNDATIEKLAELLNENPNGLLLFRDELVGLLAGRNLDGKATELFSLKHGMEQGRTPQTESVVEQYSPKTSAYPYSVVSSRPS